MVLAPKKMTLTAVTMTLLATGCGSAGREKPALTAAQYKAKAQAICRETSKNGIPFPGKRSGNGLVTTAKLIAPYLQKTLVVERAAVGKLKALEPPPNDRAGAT